MVFKLFVFRNKIVVAFRNAGGLGLLTELRAIAKYYEWFANYCVAATARKDGHLRERHPQIPRLMVL